MASVPLGPSTRLMLFLYAFPAVIGYLLGSFPTGYLVGRSRGLDIREHGSGNIGATNVVRVLGKKLGYFVFACDAFKGWLAVTLAVWWTQQAGDTAHGRLLHSVAAALPFNPGDRLALPSDDAHLAGVAVLAGIVAALACILGHNFPVWLKFRGGKGVATTVGVLLGLMPAAIGVAAVIWAASFFLFRYVSLASLLGAASLPITVWLLTNHSASPATNDPLFWFSVAAAALIFWRHRTNIQRLLKGTEPRFDRRQPASPPPPTP